MQIAMGIQRPGQTKEQTKLIARGIQQGIEQYKAKYKTRSRDVDRKLKRLEAAPAPEPRTEFRDVETVRYRQHWLPWVLLAFTWVGIVVLALVGSGNLLI